MTFYQMGNRHAGWDGMGIDNFHKLTKGPKMEYHPEGLTEIRNNSFTSEGHVFLPIGDTNRTLIIAVSI